ncbi:acyltransferase family protein [Erythrobacter arachoides]|uniref:Acyltransferase family protein n=1 Tax=Aurantiacibacter arachoides TaxID=1850444 RepID=A0A845A497_9SPHN|nr:acyltransferase [Aurantiacibacter arachoides]MXO92409.1 acyltransferase family protein [Aurantiacibacter arachoides]GGD57393.1 acyltransferase [Aurantiacibacter arachoides]
MNGVAEPSATNGRPPRRDRFVVLDSWRGLAALGVVWHHVNAPNAFFMNPLHDHMDMAVDFFFVLSGFVIAASYGERLAEGFSLGKFMFLRFMRLWPLHVVVLAAFVVLELVFLGLGSFDFLQGREPFGAGRSPAELLATTFLLQEYFFPHRYPWNTASWSISVELGLYLFAGAVFHLFGRRAVPAALLVSLAAGLVLMSLDDLTWSGVLRGLTGFGLGIACQWVWQRTRDLRFAAGTATLAELAMVAAILASIAFVSVALVTDLVFALGVWLFAYQRGAVSRLLLRPAFVWLGTLSYSIYMVHGMVVGRTYDVLGLVQSSTGVTLAQSGLGGADRLLLGPAGALAVFAAMLAMTVVVAWVTWRFVEDPARRWSKRRAERWGAGAAERAAPTI